MVLLLWALLAVMAGHLVVSLVALIRPVPRPEVHVYSGGEGGGWGRVIHQVRCFIRDDGAISFREDGSGVLLFDDDVRGKILQPEAGKTVSLMVVEDGK